MISRGRHTRSSPLQPLMTSSARWRPPRLGLFVLVVLILSGCYSEQPAAPTAPAAGTAISAPTLPTDEPNGQPPEIPVANGGGDGDGGGDGSPAAGSPSPVSIPPGTPGGGGIPTLPGGGGIPTLPVAQRTPTQGPGLPTVPAGTLPVAPTRTSATAPVLPTPTKGAQIPVAPTATTAPVIPDLPSPTPGDTPTVTEAASPVTTGYLVITSRDRTVGDGEPIPGACFEVDGPEVREICDDDDDDARGSNGVIGFRDLPPGEYQVKETKPPTGYLPAAGSLQTDIEAGDIEELAFENEPLPEGGVVEIFYPGAEENSMSGACITLASNDPGVPSIGPICDNVPVKEGETGDTDPAVGTIRIEDVPAGNYAITEDEPPIGAEPADIQTRSVGADEVTRVEMPAVSAAETTGELIVTITDEAQNPVSGTCLVLGPGGSTEETTDTPGQAADPATDSTAEEIRVCDDDPASDLDPNPGIIHLTELPAGTYTLRLEAPEDVTIVEPSQTEITITAGQTFETSFRIEGTAPTEQVAVDLASAVVFVDTSNRLWLARPGQEPTLVTENLVVSDQAVPTFTGDSTFLAYLAAGDTGEPALFFFDVNAGSVIPADLGLGGAPTAFYWSPTEARLAVAVQTGDGRANLVLVAPNQPGTPVFAEGTNPGEISTLAWSSDGTRLAVETASNSGDPHDLTIIDVATTAATTVGPQDGTGDDRFFGWQPGGSNVLMVSDGLPFLVDAGGGIDPIAIGSTPAFIDSPTAAPVWSGDGSAVAFVDGDPAEGANLVIATTDGVTCENPIADVTAFAWRADSLQLAIVVNDGDAQTIRFTGADCAPEGDISLTFPVERLEWSADGEVLAIVGQPEGDRRQVALIDTATGLIPIVTDQIPVREVLGWSAGSRILALAVDREDTANEDGAVWVVSTEQPIPAPLTGTQTEDNQIGTVTDLWWPPAPQ